MRTSKKTAKETTKAMVSPPVNARKTTSPRKPAVSTKTAPPPADNPLVEDESDHLEKLGSSPAKNRGKKSKEGAIPSEKKVAAKGQSSSKSKGRTTTAVPEESSASGRKEKVDSGGEPESLRLARRCVELVMDKKALSPVILDLTQLSTITDYFVICSAQSEPQLKAIAQGLEKTLKDDDEIRPFAVDGFPASQWIVVDYGTVMVHIFHEARRAVYALEELWSDAPRLDLDPAAN